MGWNDDVGVISHCNTPSQRSLFYKRFEFITYTSIDKYSGGNRQCHDDEMARSFERSVETLLSLYHPPPPNPPFLSFLDTSHGRPPFILPHAHPRRPHRFQRLRRHGHRKSMAPRRNTRTIILPGRRRIQIQDNDNNPWRGIRSMEERI